MNPAPTNISRRTIGLLGGSFDPLHLGHLALAQHALQQLPLDEVWLLPVGRPRHRGVLIADFATRFAWVEAAVAELAWPAIKASAADAPRADGAVNATVKVLRQLRDSAPATSWVWLLGADAFSRFDQWLDWQDIPKLAHLVVCTRPPHTLQLNECSPALQAQWQQSAHDPLMLAQHTAGVMTTLNFPALPLSASAIRAQLSGRQLTLNPHEAHELGLSTAVLRQLCQYNPYL